MKRQLHAELLGRRRHRLQELDQMLAEPRMVDALVLQQLVAEFRDGHRLRGGARQGAGDHHDQVVDVGLAHGLIGLLRLGSHLRREISLGARPFEDEELEGREAHMVEAQRVAPVGIGASRSVRAQSTTGMKL